MRTNPFLTIHGFFLLIFEVALAWSSSFIFIINQQTTVVVELHISPSVTGQLQTLTVG